MQRQNIRHLAVTGVLSFAVLLFIAALPAVTVADSQPLAPQARQMEESIAKIKKTLRQETFGQMQDISNPPRSTREKEDILGTGLQLLKALGFCIGVLLIGTAITKRLRGTTLGASGRYIKILERTPIAPKTWLVLTSVAGRQVLMAVAPEGVSFGPVWKGTALDKRAQVSTVQPRSQPDAAFVKSGRLRIRPCSIEAGEA